MRMRFPILISYAYARMRAEDFAVYASDPNIEVLLDCGAFTAKNTGKEILLGDYCTFLDKWGPRLFRYLALDKVGDPVETESNLKEMIRQGYAPVPVHVLGDDERRMDELFEVSDYVALAGFRRPKRGACSPEYVKAKMRWARGRDVHWLGYVREEMIGAFKPFSCDSSSWDRARMYGGVDIYIGNGRWVASDYRNRQKILRSREALDVLTGLGFSVRDIHDERLWRRNLKLGIPDSRFLSAMVTTDSWVRYVIDVRKRWGTRLFIATSLADDLDILKAAIDRHVKRLEVKA